MLGIFHFVMLVFGGKQSPIRSSNCHLNGVDPTVTHTIAKLLLENGGWAK